MGPSLFTSSVQFQLLEVLFDLPAMFDWKLIPLLADQEAGATAMLESLAPIDVNAVAPYLGHYANPDLGHLTLMLSDDQFVVTDGQLVITLQPLQEQVGMATVYVPVTPPAAGNPPAVLRHIATS